MIKQERAQLLNERKGLLADNNLWSFWDGISDEYKNAILEYFENTPLLFDYKSLFKGNRCGDFYHGPLSTLGTIFVKSNIVLLDYFFAKFLEFTPKNYSTNSSWGLNWENSKLGMIKVLTNHSVNSDEPINYSNIESLRNLSIDDVYWTDAHFFVQHYSSIVYKAFLNNQCDSERFVKAFEFCFNNIDIIKYSITRVMGWDKPLRNGIVDQYLIFLEKAKRFNECINIMEKMKDKGWNNDFEKRIERCLKKKENEQRIIK